MNTIDWHKEYVDTLSNYASEVNVSGLSVLKHSHLATEKIFMRIVEKHKNGIISAADMSTLCEVLSQLCNRTSGIWGTLIYTADIAWYVDNEPEKVEFMLEYVYQEYNTLRRTHTKLSSRGK